MIRRADRTRYAAAWKPGDLEPDSISYGISLFNGIFFPFSTNKIRFFFHPEGDRCK